MPQFGLYHIRLALGVILGSLMSVPHVCLAQQEKAVYFDHLTIREGLSHNTVFDIIQDTYGYIWVGTQHGLNKYDGYDFEVYRSNGSNEGKEGFVGKSILTLFEDSKTNLWVGTRRQGINLRKAGTDRFVNLQSEAAFSAIQGYEITSFFEDKAGNIWISTIDGGILQYNPISRESLHFSAEKDGLSNDAAFDIIEDNYGILWVGTAGEGLSYRKKNGTFESIQTAFSGYRKKMLLEGDTLWVATEGSGLYKMNVKDHRFQQYAQQTGTPRLTSNIAHDVLRASDGQLYIATDGGGLHIYDEKKGSMLNAVSQIGQNDQLNSNALLCFWEDRTGNIWIGTFNGGINIYKANKTWFDFITPRLKKQEELSNKSILSVCQTRDEKIWIGTDGGGLTYLHPGGELSFGRTYTHDPEDPSSLPGNIVKAIFEDSKGRIWLGFYGEGMARFDPETESFKHYTNQAGNPNSLGGENVWDFCEGKDGTIYIALIGGGLTAFDPEPETFRQFPIDAQVPSALSEPNIMTVFIDRENRFWAGTADKGLYLGDVEKQGFQPFEHDPADSLSLSNDEIRAIYQDSRGNIWIGTEGGGLNRWKGEGHFERITEADGLISNSVMGITEDKAGNLWVTTFEGLSRIDSSLSKIRNFDFHTGENSDQFNHLAILCASNGRLFFGGINGLHSIFPDQVKEKQPAAELIFTGLQLFNQPVPVGTLEDGRTILDRPIEEADRIHLHYYDNSFSLSFAAIDYTSPLENTFLYKMEGFNENWQQTLSGQHSVNYTNLDPGTYTFRVKYAAQEASIQVIIQPPFWKTAWFRTLAILAVIGLVFLGIYFLIKRREVIHKQRLLKAKTEILHLQNEKLETEVSAKNSKLMFSAVQMAHKNEILTTVKEEVKNLNSDGDPRRRQLLRMLNQELKSENYWKEFNLYFNQVDSNFNQAMLEKHPELTPNDLRICALIRINLTTKEIASLLNISVRGVEQSRYRLKKRLGLGSDESLVKYITGFNPNA